MNPFRANTIDAKIEHLRDARDRNVHLVRWPRDVERVEIVARGAAVALDRHFALMKGRTLHTEADVLEALEEAFLFPPGLRAGAITNWNTTGDLLGDLSWLFTGPSSRSGVIALVRDPSPFIRENLLQFSLLIHELASRSQWLIRRNIPFSIIIGPLPEDARYEVFMNMMTISDHFCYTCQCLDDEPLNTDHRGPDQVGNTTDDTGQTQ